ncbi:hypothetical protein GALMADRAFT_235522 [Galerina marginata CBS 339.88]|uniref:Uncharacterized protein n=1 Tax=Galerina marginata (strain CBS 339.88) TaxID=685588 RepID=A0A067TWM2_GALM3|nr:hypothetical protein GALMADRAFT_235522 [Galerina marginata CBS 339.88]
MLPAKVATFLVHESSRLDEDKEAAPETGNTSASSTPIYLLAGSPSAAQVPSRLGLGTIFRASPPQILCLETLSPQANERPA